MIQLTQYIQSIYLIKNPLRISDQTESKEGKQKFIFMKIVKSSIKNQDFFSRYALIVSVLGVVALLGQFLSGITESIIIYATLEDTFARFLSSNKVLVFSVLGAIIGTCMIEVGNKVLIPYSVQSILYKRFKGLDLVVTLFVLPCTLFLMSIGTIMSFKGSKVLTAKAKGEYQEISTDSILTQYNAELLTLNTAKDDRLDDLSKELSTSVISIQALYDSKIKSCQNQISRLKQKEIQSGRSYKTSIANQESKILSLQTECNTKQDQIRQDFAERKKTYLDKYDSKVATLDGGKLESITIIKQTNQDGKTKHQKDISSYGSLLGWLNVVMMFVLLVATIIKEVHHKGSGIQTKVFVKDSYFEESFFALLFKSILDWFEVKGQRLIRWIQSKTDQRPEPSPIPVIFDRSQMIQEPIQTVRPQIGFHNRNGHENQPNTHESEPTKKDYTLVNTQRLYNKTKYHLRRLKNKGKDQEKSKGVMTDRTRLAIQNNTKKLKELKIRIEQLKNK